jgi:hypothetical protein
MNSWKTTSTGLLTIIGALTTLWFQHATLTPELVITAATAILGGVGLLFARDNDKSSEDVGATTPQTILPKSGPLLALALCASLVAFTPGCSTTPGTAVYRTAGTAKITVDSAMHAWGDYVKAFHPPIVQEQQVKTAFYQYQLAQVAILDAAINYKTAEDTGDAQGQDVATTAMHAATLTASGALADLIGLIQSFGVKINPQTS